MLHFASVTPCCASANLAALGSSQAEALGQQRGEMR